MYLWTRKRNTHGSLDLRKIQNNIRESRKLHNRHCGNKTKKKLNNGHRKTPSIGRTPIADILGIVNNILNEFPNFDNIFEKIIELNPFFETRLVSQKPARKKKKGLINPSNCLTNPFGGNGINTRNKFWKVEIGFENSDILFHRSKELIKVEKYTIGKGILKIAISNIGIAMKPVLFRTLYFCLRIRKPYFQIRNKHENMCSTHIGNLYGNRHFSNLYKRKFCKGIIQTRNAINFPLNISQETFCFLLKLGDFCFSRNFFFCLCSPISFRRKNS